MFSVNQLTLLHLRNSCSETLFRFRSSMSSISLLFRGDIFITVFELSGWLGTLLWLCRRLFYSTYSDNIVLLVDNISFIAFSLQFSIFTLDLLCMKIKDCCKWYTQNAHWKPTFVSHPVFFIYKFKFYEFNSG